MAAVPLPPTILLSPVPIDGSTCTFAVQSLFCGNVGGNLNDVFQVVLKGNLIEMLDSMVHDLITDTIPTAY